ncbi:hypothetical protein RHMOL_Rhmol01G0138900 [Rhododendron molle]|uniref:Uncharacterized protein n=1 Tax=Rhododendron molle TaxID=49168 RepID=A0ACC0Q349_RHOML|nr:hypothetical protein RHMOL_Rhmol01G0138900 [Rhododendron molle]
MFLLMPKPVPAKYQDSRWSWFQRLPNEWTVGRDALAAAMYNHCLWSYFLHSLHNLNAFVAMDTNEVEVVEGPTKQKRRTWRGKEEDALMKCMVNDIGDKWRVENEFKIGFFTHLEKELEKVLPGSNLKAIIPCFKISVSSHKSLIPAPMGKIDASKPYFQHILPISTHDICT